MKDKKLMKNYIILCCIFIAVFLLMLYINKWHHAYIDYEKETPVIRGTLKSEITVDDFEHFMYENPSSVIYMCTSLSETCRSFEKEFKQFVVKRNLQDSIVYLNLTNSDISKFVNDFNNDYKYKINLTSNYPALVEFSDGKVTSLIEGTTDEPLTIKEVTSFIDINHIGEGE